MEIYIENCLDYRHIYIYLHQVDDNVDDSSPSCSSMRLLKVVNSSVGVSCKTPWAGARWPNTGGEFSNLDTVRNIGYMRGKNSEDKKIDKSRVNKACQSLTPNLNSVEKT